MDLFFHFTTLADKLSTSTNNQQHNIDDEGEANNDITNPNS